MDNHKRIQTTINFINLNLTQSLILQMQVKVISSMIKTTDRVMAVGRIFKVNIGNKDEFIFEKIIIDELIYWYLIVF